LKSIGLKAEKAMYKATKNINTHKGMIFILGVFLPVLKHCILEDDIESLQATIKARAKALIGTYYEDLNKPSSHGDEIYLKYGLKGVRQSALDGFNVAIDVIYENPYERLVQLMKVVDDTTIVYRHNLSGLRRVQHDMETLLKRGPLEQHMDAYESLSNLYKKSGISPGGSADLWVISTLLLNLKKEVIN
jgi:triphosphoribosyl-dephospho-CoA synthetase